jgi:hypothetical protein
MCFFDFISLACGCWKWGHFRQHCGKEHRTGEVCGMRLIWNIIQGDEKCNICIKIEPKERVIRREEQNIIRWELEGGWSANIERAQNTVFKCKEQLGRLLLERDEKRGRY